MTKPYLEKVGDTVSAYWEGMSGPVALEGEYPLFEKWQDQYQTLYRTDSAADEYKELGSAMLAWLKEKGLWAQLAKGVRHKGFLEIRVSPDELRWAEKDQKVQDACAHTRIFLDLPWEILAENDLYLAAHSGTPFCPIRRIGKPNGNIASPSPYRLSMAFMAASPSDVRTVLNFELEESAILRATRDKNLELVVEESGNLDQLSETIGDMYSNLPSGHRGMDALHLSCHGRADRVAEPLLLLESEVGTEKTVTANKFLSALSLHKPRLLFLSACQSAKSAANAVSDSMALACVKEGMPAVIGWGESVYDSQASLFAANLYKFLSNNGDLESSVARARYSLLVPEDERAPAQNWHLARLYLGPDGGGVLANGTKARLSLSRDHGVKAFLDTDRQQVPVASRFDFVGRRRDIQQILAEFNSKSHAGVCVHGTGRQGKSSLAARIACRMPNHEVVVVYGPKERGGDQSVHYQAHMILEAIAKKDMDGIDKIMDSYREEVRNNPAQLRAALKKILKNCDNEQKPILLVVDDFEQALVAPESDDSIHMVKPDCSPAIAALIEAFDAHTGRSRLLFTSRYRFCLHKDGRDLCDKLLYLNLRPMKEEESRKQALAKNNSSGDRLENVLEMRIIKAVKGNAGLQDRLFRLGVEDEDACITALEHLEAYIAEGRDPEQEVVRAHLDDIFAKTTFELLNRQEQDILRLSTLFNVPVVDSVFTKFVQNLSIMSVDDNPDRCFKRLVAFGLWDTMPDYFEPQEASFIAAPLAAPRALGSRQFSEEEIRGAINAILPDLLSHWGGADRSKRPFAFDEELFRLAMRAENAAILNICSADALRSLKDKTHYVTLAETAEKALEIILTKTRPDPELLYVAAEICQDGGKTASALEMAYEAVESYERRNNLDNDDQFQLSSARLRLARLQNQSGYPDKALEQFKSARDEFEQLGDARSRAITLGDIAKIYTNKGKIEQALELHRERLKVYEQLGDTRSRAVTLGDIARIYTNKGKIEQALELMNEAKLIYEQLGDTRSRAVTLGDIARIYTDKGKIEQALELMNEAKLIYEQLGDTRSRAVTLGDIARIYTNKGKIEQALELMNEAKLIYEQLGDTRSRAVTLGDIARIYTDKGKIEQALELMNEAKLIYEQLGDTRSRAVTLGDIARIYTDKGKIEQALELMNEAKLIFEQLGDTRSRAVTLGDIARIYKNKGKIEQALELHRERLKVYEQLGDTRERAVTLGDIARIYKNKGKIEQALELMNEAKLIYEQLGNLEGIAATKFDIAQIHLAREEEIQPLPLLKSSFELFLSIGRVDGILAVGRRYADVLFHRNEYEQALPVLDNLAKVYQSLGQTEESQQLMGVAEQIRKALQLNS
ncbi:tetratricopeptide repeat protein [Maridesulfovibrio sp.]|uniref:tetratricopeptide repeat protein n=1 Tax=Maridesulfovibrio sp. TaxID=2795000 RepID=UPI002A18B549|nr:tetratricopeptide repeat protein [Maridesulfovibrio sp.]